MRSGICVKCQETKVYRVPLRRYADTGFPLTTMRRANVTVLVCTECGYLETYVDQDSLEKVREHGKRVGFVPDPPAKPFWEA
jgi:Zn ribbon nucleic-acid-binding protein